MRTLLQLRIVCLTFNGMRTHRAKRAGLTKEYLVPHGIPANAVVATIPATARSYDIPIHLDRLKTPGALVREAGEASEDAIWNWAMEEVFMRTGICDTVMTQRLVRAMCVKAS